MASEQELLQLMAMQEQIARLDRMINSGDFTDHEGNVMATPESAKRDRDRLMANLAEAAAKAGVTT